MNNLYFIYGLMFFIVLVIIAIFISKLKTKRKIKQAGNKGETLFNHIAKEILYKEDILLNNVKLNADGKKTEIDNIIINKNGIFIVEVKNYNGTLYGDINDFEWTKEKISPGGNVFVKQVKNPIKQIKRQKYILSKYLKNNGIHIWIEGYVYFVNNNSPINDDCVIKNINSFNKTIHSNQGKTYNAEIIKKVIKILS